MVTLVVVISGVVVNNDIIIVYKVIGFLLLISGIVYLSLSQNKREYRIKREI